MMDNQTESVVRSIDFKLRKVQRVPSVPPLERSKVIYAKRTAMELLFWCACPVDDDHGFDRLMGMKHIADLDSLEWGSVFLHKHLEGRDIAMLQKFAFENAIGLLHKLGGVAPDVARESLISVATMEAPNGIYTV